MRKQSTPPPMGAAGRRQNADLMRLLAQGKIDAVGTVTLTPGATTTTVDDDGAVYCSDQSGVFLTPQSANAAAAIGTTWITPGNGSFVIHHANNAQVDRTFAYAVLG